MRVLLLGATGQIGSSVAARLHSDGHEIVGLGRGRAPVSGTLDRWIALDLREITRPEQWLSHLAGVDAVVNCAGALQDSARDSTVAVHRDAPSALWEACVRAGVPRVIHFSAMGVDRGALTGFSETKHAGDLALEAHDLDWVILRPSVVVGRPAYGGSALFRGLAALPVLPKAADAGPLDIVQLDDVVETVALLLRPGAPSRVTLELAGPERLRFEEVVARYRRWLGRKPARVINVSPLLMRMSYRLGDAIAWLGWRPPIRTTARREIVRGAIGDPGEWIRLTGIRPHSLDEALAGNPASVQERWFSNLYLLKPVMLGAFALFWLMTGLISLGPGFPVATRLMEAAGAGPLSIPSVIGGAIADLLVGIGIVVRSTARRALIAALLLSVFYVIAGSLLLPELWRDPLGPMMKIWPILAFNLACLAILEER